MYEIEAKAWLKTREEKNRVIGYLQENGTFVKSTVKNDTYFAKKNAETFDFRIRKMDGEVFVTRKKRALVRSVERNEELEFMISSEHAFLGLIDHLGYVVFLEKTKTTDEYSLGENFTAEIVNIRGLGDFLEIERLCSEKKEIADAQTSIERIFAELSLEKNIEPSQYTVLLRQKERSTDHWQK